MRDRPTIDGSPIEYRTATGTYHVYHDWSTERPLSATVLEAYTAVAGEDASPTSPMWNSLDVCAIDELFLTDEGRPRTEGHLTFVHDEYEIEVHTNGLVRIRPPTVEHSILSGGSRPGTPDSV